MTEIIQMCPWDLVMRVDKWMWLRGPAHRSFPHSVLSTMIRASYQVTSCPLTSGSFILEWLSAPRGHMTHNIIWTGQKQSAAAQFISVSSAQWSWLRFLCKCHTGRSRVLISLLQFLPCSLFYWGEWGRRQRYWFQFTNHGMNWGWDKSMTIAIKVTWMLCPWELLGMDYPLLQDEV